MIKKGQYVHDAAVPSAHNTFTGKPGACTVTTSGEVVSDVKSRIRLVVWQDR
jgi:hypothetical protein